MTNLDHIRQILDTMTPISLEEMDTVKLMNRVDEKYILTISTLASLLSRIAPDYYVQRIEGEAVAPYHTLYFDTYSLKMYTAHHNRKLNRQKLRVRCYELSKTTYFEIKNKNNKGKTKKKRIPIPYDNFEDCLSNPDVHTFITNRSLTPIEELVPQLENRFERITLVDKGMHERVTIDNNLTFFNRSTGQSKDLCGLVVMEVKRESGCHPTGIDEAFLEMRIRPKRMSKYCIGTAYTNPNAKINRFKSKILNIDKLIKEIK